jgi:hypothetical protein
VLDCLKENHISKLVGLEARGLHILVPGLLGSPPPRNAYPMNLGSFGFNSPLRFLSSGFAVIVAKCGWWVVLEIVGVAKDSSDARTNRGCFIESLGSLLGSLVVENVRGRRRKNRGEDKK